MELFISLIFFLLVLGSSGMEIFKASKKKERKVLCIQIGVLGLAIIGGIFSIKYVPDPSIAQVLGAVIPRFN